MVPGRTRRLAELEEKWLKAASHSEVLREQMTRKEQKYLASAKRFETQVQSLEKEFWEAKTLSRSPGPSVHDDAGRMGRIRSVTWMCEDVEDVDELHDLDLIAGDTCKGDPPSDPKRPCIGSVGGPASHASSSKLGS